MIDGTVLNRLPEPMRDADGKPLPFKVDAYLLDEHDWPMAWLPTAALVGRIPDRAGYGINLINDLHFDAVVRWRHGTVKALLVTIDDVPMARYEINAVVPATDTLTIAAHPSELT